MRKLAFAILLISGIFGLSAVVGAFVPLTITDGTNTVPNTSMITFGNGFIVGGSNEAATANLKAPDRTVTTSPTVGAGDMAGQINLNGSSLTLNIPAISSTVFPAGATLVADNFAATNVTVSSTPTVNGCPSTIYPGGFAAYLSNGVSLDCAGFPGWGQLLGQINTWTATQSSTPQTLTISTATFTPSAAAGNNIKFTLVHASCPCTLANPSGTPVAGTSGVIEITQSSSGSDTIGTWGSSYLYSGGTASIALSTGANATDTLSYYVRDSTHIVLTTAALNATH